MITDRTDEPLRLHYSRDILVIGIVITVFFVGFAALMLDQGSSEVWPLYMSIFMLLLGLYICVQFIREWHLVSDFGIDYAAIFWGRDKTAWSEITSCRYLGGGMHGFWLRTKKGERIWISALLVGIDEFARLAEAKLPQTSTDAKTRSILISAARDEC